MDKTTKAIHTRYPLPDAYGALSMPVYHVAAYEFADADIMADAFCGRVPMPDYSRVLNPTVMHLENKIKELTGASDVIAFTSGMAAISNALIALAAAGKNIVTSRHLFGNTYMLLEKTLRKFGVEPRFCDLTDLEDVKRNIDADTCCLFLEIVTNPQMEVADLRALAEIAHAQGVPLVADTTIIPFTHFNAGKLGVDVEIVSSTKYLSGGATSLGGLIIDYGTCKEFNAKIRQELIFNLGGYMTPHAAYMQTLGLETLCVRYERQAASALALARKLKELPQIKRVNYVGLEENPFHEVARRQFGETAGAMLTIDLADEQACKRFINNLKLIKRATNLFDNRSLAIHPSSTIFGPLTKEEKDAMDVLDTTIRLSVGLEDVEDLFADIKQALDAN
ncbi:MAG: PLP-dependent transferase [Muribaculaceae bacterium]|nr:PLP-dependent transferase [Muribaculaceae bacterium]